MRQTIKLIAVTFSLLLCLVPVATGQSPSDDLGSKVDAVVASVYQSASARFPCKLKTRGKLKMLRWQQIEKCLNYANDRVDWADASSRLQKIREEYRISTAEMETLIEKSILAHALTYDKVFVVKEPKALLPLSSSVLKFLPEDSLLDLPVFDSSGKEIGSFGGVYTFERTGEVSGNRFRHSLFQYKDSKGNMQSAPGRLLLDSYGVPWKGASTQPGFRLPPHQIDF